MQNFNLPQIESGYSNEQRAVKIEITRALLIGVPGGHPVHYRPLIMTFNKQSHNTINNIVDNGLNINAAALRQVARDIIRPSKQSQGVLAIENGWNEQRFSFFLEFKIKTPNMEIIEIVTGYTDVLGYSTTANFGQGGYDTNMQFFINNHMRVSETLREGPRGSSLHYKATDVSQILRPISVQQGGIKSFGGPLISAVAMRPKDAIDSAQRKCLPSGSGGIIDGRNDISNENKPLGVSSSRKNETSSAYLSTILQSYSSACNSTDGIGPETWLLGTASQYAAEPELSASLLFHHLAETTSYGQTGCFTLGQLMRAHPELDYTMSAPVLPKRGGVTNNADMCNGWGAANEHTTIAHALSHTVPAALSQCNLASASFTATNHTMDGSIDMSCQSIVPIFDSTGDEAFALRFMQTLINDIFPELFHFGIDWQLNMEVSLFGLSDIQISLNGGHFERFMPPNYADGLTSSTIGANMEQLDTIGSSTGNLIKTVFQNSSDPGLIMRSDYF